MELLTHHRKKLLIAAVILVVILLIGAVSFQAIEDDISFLDAYYYSVMSATTIGFANVVPQKNSGKIFTVFYSFFGMAALFYLFSIETANQVTQEIMREFKVNGYHHTLTPKRF
jgi:hypothetical protein